MINEEVVRHYTCALLHVRSDEFMVLMVIVSIVIDNEYAL
jgi:hypothetical protein